VICLYDECIFDRTQLLLVLFISLARLFLDLLKEKRGKVFTKTLFIQFLIATRCPFLKPTVR
jgi:hypothetical protein